VITLLALINHAITTGCDVREGTRHTALIIGLTIIGAIITLFSWLLDAITTECVRVRWGRRW